MRCVNVAVSELTGKPEAATISPEMWSEVDGKKICDGIADIDLVNMFDAGFDPVLGIIPKCLTDGRAVCAQAQEAHYRKCAKKQRKLEKRNDRADRLAAHTKRIQAEEANWGKTPTDEEIEQMVHDEPMLVFGLMRLMNRVMDLKGMPYKGIRK